MDLSQGSSQQNDFIGLMNHPQEVEQQVGYGNGLSKKEKILSNYFQSIHPIVGSSFQSPNIDAKHNLGGGGEGSTRAWNSSESKSNTTSPIRNYGSLDSIKPSELILEKDRNVPDATIVSEIDRTMKKHVDSLLHVLEGVSEKLTQLESRTRHLENSVDDLKISVGNNHGNSDGKMRQLENVLRDVQTGIQVLKDKQAIVEAQLQLGKTRVSNSKVDTQSQVSGQTVAFESTQAHKQPPHPVNLPSSLPAVSTFSSASKSVFSEPDASCPSARPLFSSTWSNSRSPKSAIPVTSKSAVTPPSYSSTTSTISNYHSTTAFSATTSAASTAPFTCTC